MRLQLKMSVSSLVKEEYGNKSCTSKHDQRDSSVVGARRVYLHRKKSLAKEVVAYVIVNPRHRPVFFRTTR